MSDERLKGFEVEKPDGSRVEYYVDINSEQFQDVGDDVPDFEVVDIPERYVICHNVYDKNGQMISGGRLDRLKISELMSDADDRTKEAFQDLLDKLTSLNMPPGC